MSITVGDVLRVVAVLSWLDGNIMQNVFSVVIGGSGGPFDEADITDDARDWVHTMFNNLTSKLSDQVDGTEVRVYVYDDVDDDYDEIGSALWTWDPSEANDQLPKGVAALLNVKTTDPDVNGKKYIGGGVENATTAGVWTAAFLTGLADFAADWVTIFVGSGSGATFVPGIWSPTRTNFYAMSGTVLIPTIPAYQRRRKAGVGI